jgi:hypothetical protein
MRRDRLFVRSEAPAADAKPIQRASKEQRGVYLLKKNRLHSTVPKQLLRAGRTGRIGNSGRPLSRNSVEKCIAPFWRPVDRIDYLGFRIANWLPQLTSTRGNRSVGSKTEYRVSFFHSLWDVFEHAYVCLQNLLDRHCEAATIG